MIIYDVYKDSIAWWPDLAIPVGRFLIVFCVAFAVAKFDWLGLSKSKKPLLWLALSIVIANDLFSIFGDYNALRHIQAAVTSRNYEQTEGLITQYQEERQKTAQTGGSSEFFVVNGQTFVVKGITRPVGFRTTIRQGSPLSVGANVRIRYVLYNDQAIIVYLEMI